MQLLLVMSWYNNRITDDIIAQYKDRLLFSFCDYYTVQYFKEKYGIKNYYTMFDVDFLEYNNNVINYYTLDKFNPTSKIICLENSSNKCKVISGNKNQKVRWTDLIDYKKLILVNVKNSWNIV